MGATQRAVADAIGLTAASERTTATLRATESTFLALMRAPSATLAGLHIRAEAAFAMEHHLNSFRTHVDGFREENGQSRETIGLHIIADLLRLKGGRDPWLALHMDTPSGSERMKLQAP